jgi:hypothetical protein
MRITRYPCCSTPSRAQKANVLASWANAVTLNIPQSTGVTNKKRDVDPKFDKTNYQTEFMIEIEQKPFRIIAD